MMTPGGQTICCIAFYLIEKDQKKGKSLSTQTKPINCRVEQLILRSRLSNKLYRFACLSLVSTIIQADKSSLKVEKSQFSELFVFCSHAVSVK